MSEETTATQQPEATQTQEVAITQEAVEKWLGTDEGKRFLQPKLDSYHTKGLQSWQEKNIDKIKTDAIEGLKAENQKEIDRLNQELKVNTINSKHAKNLLNEGLRPDKLDLAMKLSDTSKLSLDGENLIGSMDIIDGLKTSVGDWFGEQKITGKGKGTLPAGEQSAGQQPSDDGLAAMLKAAGV